MRNDTTRRSTTEIEFVCEHTGADTPVLIYVREFDGNKQTGGWSSQDSQDWPKLRALQIPFKEAIAYADGDTLAGEQIPAEWKEKINDLHEEMIEEYLLEWPSEYESHRDLGADHEDAIHDMRIGLGVPDSHPVLTAFEDWASRLEG